MLLSAAGAGRGSESLLQRGDNGGCMRNGIQSGLASFLMMSFLVGAPTVAAAAPDSDVATLDDEASETTGDDSLDYAIATLDAMPNEVLEAGPEAVRDYLAARNVDIENLGMAAQALPWQFKCAKAVGVLVVTSHPAGKAFKVARIVKRVGVKRFTSMIKSFKKGKRAALTKTLKNVGLTIPDLLGIPDVKKNCF